MIENIVIWEDFFQEAEKSHTFIRNLFCANIPLSVELYDIQGAWIKFCNSIGRIIDPYFSVSKITNPSFSAISFMHQYSEAINAGSPWSLIHFVVQFEVSFHCYLTIYALIISSSTITTTITTIITIIMMVMMNNRFTRNNFIQRKKRWNYFIQ